MALRRMESRYNGRCKSCKSRYSVGDSIFWSRQTGALCKDCGESGNLPKGKTEARPRAKSDTPKEKTSTRNANLPSVTERGRDSYFTIDWNDLREIVRTASFNAEVPSCSIAENVEMILSHTTDEISSWHGYSVGQLQRWLTEGYSDGTIHGLGDFDPPLREKRRYVYAEEGEEILLDRALSGDDDYFGGYTPKDIIPGVAVEAEIMFASSVSAEIVNSWNRFICRAVLTLETAGIDAQVTLKFSSNNACGNGKQAHSIVRVKKENEATDFQSFSAMLSPAALRTFGFTALVLQSEQSGLPITYGIGHGHNGTEWKIAWNPERRILEFHCPYIPRGSFPEDDMQRQLRDALHEMKK